MHRKILSSITIVLIWLLPYIIALMISSIFDLTPLVNLFVNECGLILGMLLTSKIHKDYIPKPEIRMNLKNISPFLAICIFVFSVSFTAIVLHLAFKDGDYFEYEEKINLCTILSYITGILVNPFFEEYVFRYMVIESMWKKRNNFSIVIFSSILFCIPHLAGIISSFDIIISSVVFAMIYLKTRNLIYTYIAHLSHNLAVEILLNTDIKVIQSNVLVIISAIILICSTVLLIISINKQYPKIINKGYEIWNTTA